jgi:CHC2 zinc finger
MEEYHRADFDPPGDHRSESFGIRRAIAAIKERVSCLDVADYHAAGQGDSWRREGVDRWRRRCILPDHEDKTPSFLVYERTDSFYCFGCKVGGDAITLEKLCGGHDETWTAVLALAQRYSVPLPERPRSWYARRERQRPIRDEIYEAKVYAARRRLYRTFFEPIILASEDEEDRAHDAQLFWEITDLLARHLIDNMMGGQGGW